MRTLFVCLFLVVTISVLPFFGQSIPIGSTGALAGGPVGNFTWTNKTGGTTGGAGTIFSGWSPSTPVIGDTVVCALSTGASGTWTVTDAGGNTYAHTSQFLTSGNGWVQIFYSANIATNAGTISGSFGACTSGCGQWCFNAQNTATSNGALVDVTGTGTNSSTTGGTITVSLTTTNNGEGIFCAAGMGNINGPGTVSAGTGFTGFHVDWNRMLIENRVQTTFGAQNNTATYDNQGVTAGMLCAALNHS